MLPQAQPLFPQLLAKALELVMGCNCRATSGCPACIQSMSCDEYNAVLHKDAAIAILEITLEAEAEYAERTKKQVTCNSSAMHASNSTSYPSLPCSIACFTWHSKGNHEVGLGPGLVPGAPQTGIGKRFKDICTADEGSGR